MNLHKLKKSVIKKVARTLNCDVGLWSVKATVEKWHDSQSYAEGLEPDEIVVREGNLLYNEGINEIWQLVAGTGGTAYSAANARIGISDDSTASVATGSDLDIPGGNNEQFNIQESGYPLAGTGQQITFKSAFASGEANWAWNSWCVVNNTSDSTGFMLNRKQESLGTKSSGTWTLTVIISLS